MNKKQLLIMFGKTMKNKIATLIFMILIICSQIRADDFIEANEKILTEENQLIYSWIFNACFRGQRWIGMPLAETSSFFLNSVWDISKAGVNGFTKGGVNGGLAGMGSETLVNAGFTLLKYFVKHPSYSAKAIAIFNYKNAYKAYLENYKIYDNFISKQLISKSEVDKFIQNSYLVKVAIYSKELWNSTVLYEQNNKNYLKKTTYKSNLQQLTNNLVSLQKDIKNYKTAVEFINRYNQILNESQSGFMSYPPYISFENKIRELYKSLKEDSYLTKNTETKVNIIVGETNNRIDFLKYGVMGVIPWLKIIAEEDNDPLLIEIAESTIDRLSN